MKITRRKIWERAADLIRLGKVFLLKKAKGEEICLSLSGALPPPGRFVHGGRVKLLQLRDRFGDNFQMANIFYLVSSGQVRAAVRLAKLLKKRGLKFVWNQNGVGFPAWAGENYKKINAPMRELIGLADFIVYQSEFCRQSADIYLGKTVKPWKILYNAVDLQKFIPRAEALPSTKLKLLVAGTHNQKERVSLALDALRILLSRGIDAELTIAGQLNWLPEADAETKSMLEEKKLTEKVVFAGKFLQAEAPRLYQNAHILLHLKYNDPCPTVPIEAMACGVPVIGSASGGMPELVGEDGGILLPVPQNYERPYYPDAVAIADSAQKIFVTWPEMSARARQLAERLFDVNYWLDEHERIFKNLLHE